MNEELEKQNRRMLINRAERLAKLVELNAPDSVLANEFTLLMKSGLLVLGEGIFDGLTTILIEQARLSRALCRTCDNRLDNSNGKWCPFCNDCLGKQKLEEFQAEMEYGE